MTRNSLHYASDTINIVSQCTTIHYIEKTSDNAICIVTDLARLVSEDRCIL